ncbi:MAG: short-chain dehydrogenase [Bacteroidetes bacterium]|nr:short-chain dehydrogenase [Bacteroidota bacterium]
MTNDQISSFFQNAKLKNRIVKIDFKSRASIVGLFIESKDSDELNAKNFWRIINEPKIEEFFAHNDTSLARIFNGSEFTRLSLPKN